MAGSISPSNDSVPRYLYRIATTALLKTSAIFPAFALTNEVSPRMPWDCVRRTQHATAASIFRRTFPDDYKTLYRNDGDFNFAMSPILPTWHPTISILGWGAGFLDFDNDGLLVSSSANGYVYRRLTNEIGGTTWAERSQLFRNLMARKFQRCRPQQGAACLVVPLEARLETSQRWHIDVVLTYGFRSGPVRHVVTNGSHWMAFQLVDSQEPARRRRCWSFVTTAEFASVLTS